LVVFGSIKRGCSISREEASYRVSKVKKQAVGSALSPPQFKLFTSTSPPSIQEASCQSARKLWISRLRFQAVYQHVHLTKQHAAIAFRHVLLFTHSSYLPARQRNSTPLSTDPLLFDTYLISLSPYRLQSTSKLSASNFPFTIHDVILHTTSYRYSTYLFRTFER